ncbi:hypothetical protein Tco_1474680 [Tanacetum coccineum]
MTRSSTNELFTPYKEPEREFQSSKRHFKTLCLDEVRLLDFNLLSDQEYSEEEVAETMTKTMEQYMSKTRAAYGSGLLGTKLKDNDNIELKVPFPSRLRTNTFSGLDHEDANEHIEKVLEIVDQPRIMSLLTTQIKHESTLCSVITEYLLNISKRRAFWSLNEDILRINDSDYQYGVKMDNPNITMEEYVKLEEEKARKRGKVFNWETTKYGKIWYDEDVHDLRSVETEFLAIFFNDKLTSEEVLS